LKHDELIARAEKEAGYGMVTKVALPGGKSDDWFAKANPQWTPKSLSQILALSGRSNDSPDHEDIFQATVKDFANEAYRTILCCYRDMSMKDYQRLKSQNNNFLLESDRFCLEKI